MNNFLCGGCNHVVKIGVYVLRDCVIDTEEKTMIRLSKRNQMLTLIVHPHPRNNNTYASS